MIYFFFIGCLLGTVIGLFVAVASVLVMVAWETDNLWMLGAAGVVMVLCAPVVSYLDRRLTGDG